MIYKSRPAGSRDDRKNDGEDSPKKYRAEVISLNMGGKSAKIDQYIGTGFVPMRVVERITNAGGIRKAAFSIDGFIPETGRPAMIFFDTKLRRDTPIEERQYVKNFGGGLAETLCEPATPREAQEVLEEVNEENGTDVTYNWEDWDEVGGLLKLKEEMYGKPMVIGKQYIKTKAGGFNMNVFKYDPLPRNMFPELENDIERWESLRGEPYSPDEEEMYVSSVSEETGGESGSVVEEEWIPEPEPELEPEPATKKSAVATRTRKPATRTRGREETAKEVASEFNYPAKETAVSIPDSVSDYIKDSYAKKVSTDQIVLGLVQDMGLKSRDAVDYIDAYLDKMGANASKFSRPVTQKPESKPVESELVKVAKECKAKNMDSPETFDILQQKFPDVSREEKRAALKAAGLIRT